VIGAHLHLDFVPGPCPASAGLFIPLTKARSLSLTSQRSAARYTSLPLKRRPGKRNAPPGPGGLLKVPGWCVSKTVGRRPRYGTGLHWEPPPYDAPRSRQFQYSSRLSKKVTVRGLCELSRLVATAAEIELNIRRNPHTVFYANRRAAGQLFAAVITLNLFAVSMS
jgi:hypothetical protein